MRVRPIHAALQASLLASAASLLITGTAQAQSAPAAEAPETDIVVTGTRLQVNGYQQPTPVSIIGVEKLERDNKTDLAAVMADFPAVGPSQSANSGLGTQSLSANTAGLSLINLRNLGIARTLVLFDGIRVAPSAEFGGTDLNLLPSSLIQRIDVVTGGASAAWGSDAVSGVINVILNKKFSGLTVHGEVASDEGGFRQQAKGEVSYGTKIGDRGHLILSGSYLYSPDRVIPTQMRWWKAQNLVNNPAYTLANNEPQYIHAENVGMVNATQGGLITSGPLRGIQFIGNGTPVPFNFGQTSGTLGVGGTFANPVYNGQVHNLTTPMKATNLFGHFSYELGAGITFNFELNYGKTISNTNGPSYTRNNNVIINFDNAYLDPSIAAQMANATLAIDRQRFLLSTTNTNNAIVQNGDDPTNLGVGNWNGDSTRTLFRQVASLDGSFTLGGQWKWNIDGQHSVVHRKSFIRGNPITARYDLATDAVRVTAANVGTSGLPVGTIVCRSRLTTPGNGCLPLNVMGIGVADPAAIAWVQGTSDGPGMNTDLYFKQWTASAAIRGEPFSTWAGPVAMAFGTDYRRDSLLQTADPLSYARAYTLSNRQFIKAAQSSVEGFGEIGVPLVKDGFVNSLDINGAYRFTHYSSSGNVSTWKVGGVSQLNDHVRVRATYSRDIRQPSLLELYDPGASQAQVVIDPIIGTPTYNQSVGITTLIAGNPNLKPEKAKTFTAGIVLTPTFLPGLSASVDYYTITIKDALATPNVNQVFNNCVAGNQNFCQLIQRSSNGSLLGLLVGPVNAASTKTAGFDFQLDYRFPAFGGDMNFTAVGNLITRLFTDSLGTVANSLNSMAGGNAGPNKFRSTYTMAYKADRWGAAAQVRLIGAAKLNTQWTARNVDNNDVPAIAYLDLRANYTLDSAKRFNAYIAVDNVLNQDPPIMPNPPTAAFAYFFVPTRTELYDFLGRQFRVGIRAKF